jgi:hypothetical protein
MTLFLEKKLIRITDWKLSFNRDNNSIMWNWTDLKITFIEKINEFASSFHERPKRQIVAAAIIGLSLFSEVHKRTKNEALSIPTGILTTVLVLRWCKE